MCIVLWRSLLLFILLKIPVNTKIDTSFFFILIFFTVSQALRNAPHPLFCIQPLFQTVLKILSYHSGSTHKPVFDFVHNSFQLTVAVVSSESKTVVTELTNLYVLERFKPTNSADLLIFLSFLIPIMPLGDNEGIENSPGLETLTLGGPRFRYRWSQDKNRTCPSHGQCRLGPPLSPTTELQVCLVASSCPLCDC